MADQTILVTGAGSGIGRASALLATRGGACVVACDVDAGAAGGCAEEIAKVGGEAIAFCSATRLRLSPGRTSSVTKRRLPRHPSASEWR